jgi:prepilin-type N-terminal cleavage/methylation domain-containing protein
VRGQTNLPNLSCCTLSTALCPRAAARRLNIPHIKRPTPMHHSRTTARLGFTLVELLIVIAIIAVLMGLSLSVMSGLTSQAEQEATNATIRKLDGLLQQRMEAFYRAFTGPRKNAAVDIVSGLLARQEIFGVREEVKEIIAKKRLFRFEFPQRFAERAIEEHGSNFDSPRPQVSLTIGTQTIYLPNSIFFAIAAPAARQRLTEKPTTEGGSANPTPAEVLAEANRAFSQHRPETESAELLYFALTSSTSYGVPQVDTDYFTNREVADTDGDGLPEFIDAWGFPLRYYRWPTRLIDRNAPFPFQPVLSDPNDPTDIRTPNGGQRQIIGQERQIATTLMKALASPPVMMPNGTIPRDMLLIDPDDPVGRLYSELERLDGTNGKPLLRAFFSEGTETPADVSDDYHTPDTFHAPLIVSPGPDEALGLYEPNDFANRGVLAQPSDYEALLDNISNLNRRAGARR